jgi:hypothetical protein
MVGIDGMGGIGKTALAREVAVRCAEEKLFTRVIWEQAPRKYPRGRFGAKRGGEKFTYSTVLDKIARQAGAMEILNLNKKEKEVQIAQLLHAQRLLIILDNLETSYESQDEIAQKLLALLGPSKTVLTSRLRFKSDLLAIHLSGLKEMDAQHLIEQEADDKGVIQAKSITEEGLRAIVSSTGGSPLAIKFVVGQLALLPVETVLNMLEKIQVPKDERDEGDYIRFYKKILLPSWLLLSDEAKRLLISMTVFEPQLGGTLPIIQQITRLEETSLIAQIEELWRFSFVEIQTSRPSGQVRYYLHPLTHHFVLADIVHR